jgi:hypothetical protein
MVGIYFAIAAASGWVVDDFCGTPPHVGPGPWWLSQLVAAIGGAATWYLVTMQPGVMDAGVVAAGVAGGVGGGFLGSLVRGFGGGKAGV